MGFLRILHTADWHLGKTLEGRDRTEEQVQFIDELCQICDKEKVDLIVIAGDIYQTVNPSAVAEQLFYEALERLSDQGKKGVIVIAGNHDNPERISAPAPLANRHGITLIGLPYSPLLPMSFSTQTVQRIAAGPSWCEVAVPSCEHSAVVLAVPYPSEARLNQVLADSFDESIIAKAYNERVKNLFSALSAHYKKDSVNLAFSHLYVQGGLESESEIQIQVGGAYAVDPSVFPGNADYVGLGHLHRPQRVFGTTVPTRYAGSPLAYSFSEAGQQKSVTIIDITPGSPADIREIPLCSGKQLLRYRAEHGLAQVYDWLNHRQNQDAFVDLEIFLDEPLTQEITQRLRNQHPGLIHIRPVFSSLEKEQAQASVRGLSIEEMFVRFFKDRFHVEPDEAITQLFLQLAQDMHDDRAKPNAKGDDA